MSKYFSKTASTALIRQARKGLVSVEAAGAAAKKLDLKPRTLSRQWDPIGMGFESVVHLSTHSKSPTGLAAQKTHFEGFLFSPKTFDKKVKVLETHKSNPIFAKHLGSKGRTTYQEHIPEYKPSLAKRVVDKVFGKRKYKKFLSKIPGGLTDIKRNPGNIRRDPKGNWRIMDFLIGEQHNLPSSAANVGIHSSSLSRKILSGHGKTPEAPLQLVRHERRAVPRNRFGMPIHPKKTFITKMAAKAKFYEKVEHAATAILRSEGHTSQARINEIIALPNMGGYKNQATRLFNRGINQVSKDCGATWHKPNRANRGAIVGRRIMEKKPKAAPLY